MMERGENETIRERRGRGKEKLNKMKQNQWLDAEAAF